MLSAANCERISTQKLGNRKPVKPTHLFKATKQNLPGIVIIGLMLSLLVCPKVITLSSLIVIGNSDCSL